MSSICTLDPPIVCGRRALALALLLAMPVASCVPEEDNTRTAGGAEARQETAAEPTSQKWRDTKELVRTAFPDAPQLGVSEFAETLTQAKEPPLVIDVRAPEEYAVSHLPGAVNAQGTALETLVRQAGADRDIVLYCSVGYRSSREVEKLRSQGFDNVSNLEGSIFEWANAGNPVVRGGPEAQTPTRAVHPFDETWGVLLDAERRSYTPR